MWLIIGTVPQADFPLTFGPYRVENGELCVRPYLLGGDDGGGRVQRAELLRIPVERGTAALAAAAWLTCVARQTKGKSDDGMEAPLLVLAGDTGNGTGSRAAYAWLVEHLADVAAQHGPVGGMTFHYLFPDVDWHNRVLMAVEALAHRPVLVADAGFMYVAKMSGYADSYDLFTPDVGEMAFLADEDAPHPFYTRGFLLATEEDIPGLISRARSHGNCAQHLIVKGAKDYVVQGADIIHRVDSPSVEAMEAIGGTGDIVTGMVTGLLASGLPMGEACRQAVQSSRTLAQLAQPNPATQVGELLRPEYFAQLAL